ncbi:mechanosensitive ion channel family protein [Deinococcus yavapaiensis]|uniref:Small-conductance mechanosensitive channel n=1 Tax=Deinococcus yavapaiensis KR-236 TaxID=694435 RepID=A0A318SGR0_9DEIO|nr:mechanosensitive ion channel family protein [Deinococcus yavapaiensis]PYE56594.1 small-conductance mechanosensitive channel [Deinococcus yavapaiensis KR-236]
MNADIGVAVRRLTNIGNSLIASLPNIVIALVVLLLFWLVARLVRSGVEGMLRGREHGRNLAKVLGRLASGTVLVLGILVAITIVFPSVGPGDLLGLLGVGGVAIGFAFRDIFQNLLAGLLILLTRPFRIGDQIVTGDSEGTVEDIQIRATILRTYDNRKVVIPNSDLFTQRVTVNTAYPVRRVQYDVGIGYGDDIAHAKEVILRTMAGVEGVQSDPKPEVLVVGLDGTTVNLRVRWWVDPPKRRDALASQDKVLHALKDALTAEGIDLPFPTRQILFHDQTEEADGDRARQREGWPKGSRSEPRSRAEASK